MFAHQWECAIASISLLYFQSGQIDFTCCLGIWASGRDRSREVQYCIATTSPPSYNDEVGQRLIIHNTYMLLSGPDYLGLALSLRVPGSH